MENKKTSHTSLPIAELAEKDIAIKNAIKEIERYLEDNEVSEEYQVKFSEMLKKLFEKDSENKKLIKTKLNGLCYFFKKRQGEIELVKAIAEEQKNRAKSMERQNDWLKSSILHYAEQHFDINNETLRLAHFSLYTRLYEDSIDIPDDKRVPDTLKKDKTERILDNELIKAYLKKHGNKDWGTCYNKNSLTIRGGKVKETENNKG